MRALRGQLCVLTHNASWVRLAPRSSTVRSTRLKLVYRSLSIFQWREVLSEEGWMAISCKGCT
jgi:hypothetical protein